MFYAIISFLTFWCCYVLQDDVINGKYVIDCTCTPKVPYHFLLNNLLLPQCVFTIMSLKQMPDDHALYIEIFLKSYPELMALVILDYCILLMLKYFLNYFCLSINAIMFTFWIKYSTNNFSSRDNLFT